MLVSMIIVDDEGRMVRSFFIYAGRAGEEGERESMISGY
jgi:hypothetical protein